jgi:hypothetical protein
MKGEKDGHLAFSIVLSAVVLGGIITTIMMFVHVIG